MWVVLYVVLALVLFLLVCELFKYEWFCMWYLFWFFSHWPASCLNVGGFVCGTCFGSFRIGLRVVKMWVVLYVVLVLVQDGLGTHRPHSSPMAYVIQQPARITSAMVFIIGVGGLPPIE